MENQLISTSATPLIYYKECMEKGIKRCSKCMEVKKLEEFNFNNFSKYYSSHCHKCDAKYRKRYVQSRKGKDLIIFKEKKKEDNRQGIKNLTSYYLKDSLANGLVSYLNRKNLEPDYRTIHKGITPEMIDAKKNLILLTRGLKQIKK